MAFSAVATAAPMGRQATKVGLGGGAWGLSIESDFVTWLGLSSCELEE